MKITAAALITATIGKAHTSAAASATATIATTQKIAAALPTSTIALFVCLVGWLVS